MGSLVAFEKLQGQMRALFKIGQRLAHSFGKLK